MCVCRGRLVVIGVVVSASPAPTGRAPCAPSPLPCRERPTLVGKSATKASAQQKRKAARSQQQGGGKRGQSGGGKGGGKKPRRTAAAQVVGGKGAMYNLA